MRILLSIFLIFGVLQAKVYYAKVEPYELRDISSNVSGLVIYANQNLVGSKLSSKPYIQIDSELDEKELKYIGDKLKYLEKTIDVNKKILKNLKKSLQKKKENYGKVINLKFKSKVEKDKEYYDLITNTNLDLGIQKELENLNIQITDLKLRKIQLQKSIKDKSLRAKGFILYSLLVKPGQVVGISTPLAKVADISRAKLTIYLDEQDLLNVKKKIVVIDGKKTIFKVTRVLNIADTRNISKYMAQIIMPAPKFFSKLVKVELIDE